MVNDTKKMWYYPFLTAVGILLLLFIFNAVRTFGTQGHGLIVAKINRGGHVKDQHGKLLTPGLLVALNDGTEVIIPPSRLWTIVGEGDYLSKEKGSFIYHLNKMNQHNSLLSLFVWSGQISFIIFILMVIVYHTLFFLQTKMNRRDFNEEGQ